MKIPVVLKDGQELSVSKDELHFLILTKKVMVFQRSEKWVVVGRDKMRVHNEPFSGKDRRWHGEFEKAYWY